MGFDLPSRRRRKNRVFLLADLLTFVGRGDRAAPDADHDRRRPSATYCGAL
jgi:hypothetical protein